MIIDPVPLSFTTLTVHGTPMSQGSKTAVVRGGRGHVIEGGSKTGREKHKSWREAVRSAAQQLADDTPGFRVLGVDCPVDVDVTFWLQRPTSAPRRVVTPHKSLDLDKLLRSVLDAVTGVLIEDDARIVTAMVRKRFAEPGQPTGCRIVLTEPNWPVPPVPPRKKKVA